MERFLADYRKRITDYTPRGEKNGAEDPALRCGRVGLVVAFELA
jgi:hypothetical protein